MKKTVGNLFDKDSVASFLVIFMVSSFCACAKQKNDAQILTPPIAEGMRMPSQSESRSTLPQIKPFPPNSTYKPKVGFVPNEATAIKIAEAVIVPIWGADCVKSEQPFTAVLANGVWIVEGTLAGTGEGLAVVGGTAYVEISKETGNILNIGHGK